MPNCTRSHAINKMKICGEFQDIVGSSKDDIWGQSACKPNSSWVPAIVYVSSSRKLGCVYIAGAAACMEDQQVQGDVITMAAELIALGVSI